MEILLRRFPGLSGFPHVDLGVRPTPVDEREIDGRRVFVKRDDRSAQPYGGNKVRALEFLLARPSTRVLTYSSLSAHHAFATALYAGRLGRPCDAIIVRRGARGRLREELDGVADRVVEVGGVLGAAWATAKLWRRGTLVVPPGGMSPRGALGYVAAALELEEVPDRIYVPLGSGTTVSGLLAGLMLRGAATEVVAVRVADWIATVGLWRRAFKALALLRRHDPSVPRTKRGDVRLRIVKAEGEYGEPTDSAKRAVEAAGDLPLEPTYTAKTLAVLLAERADGALFVNTYAGPISASWDRARRAAPRR